MSLSDQKKEFITGEYVRRINNAINQNRIGNLESEYSIIKRKLNEILKKLDGIEAKQESKDGYYFKNGIWRK